MIRFLPLRLAASFLTLAVVQPHPAHAAPVAAASDEARMDHISVTAMGKGSPIILIPGLSSPRAVWDGVAPVLARSHLVYLVQVNGFGGDDPGRNLQPGVLDGIVADLDRYIAAHNIARPAIVGHSLGGLVGLMFARAHPDHLARLMVVDSLPFYGMLFGPTATVAMVEPRGRAMRDTLAATYGKPADRAAAAAIADRLALKPDSRAKVTAWAMAADPRVTGEAMYEDLTTDLRPAMAGITTPITLVYPWNATGPSKPEADTLYKGAYAAAPHVRYVDIGDAAHFVMLDQPAAFLTAITAFADGK